MGPRYVLFVKYQRHTSLLLHGYCTVSSRLLYSFRVASLGVCLINNAQVDWSPGGCKKSREGTRWKISADRWWANTLITIEQTATKSSQYTKPPRLRQSGQYLVVLVKWTLTGVFWLSFFVEIFFRKILDMGQISWPYPRTSKVWIRSDLMLIRSRRKCSNNSKRF